MVKFAVCDDEWEMTEFVSDKLRLYYPDKCEISKYTDGESLLSDCRQYCFDALFLDIGMPGIDGMEIAKKVRESDWRVKIIFVTNKIDLAHQGYMYDAFRFVRKSNLEQELCEAVKSLNEIISSQGEYLVLKTPTGDVIRSAKDIKYFEAKSHFIYVVCNDEIIRVHGTMRENEIRMRNNGFIRIHKSYLVNFRNIRSVEKNAVFLTDGRKLPLSRNRSDDTKMKMMFFSRNLAM